jgi:DNA transformation protein
MFGLVSDETLYLKADAENAGYFEEEDLQKFEYIKQGKVAYIAYYQAPDIVMDDREEAALWARRSWQAAVRADEKKRSKIRRY